jgi:L,D-transpeptidase YcbB
MMIHRICHRIWLMISLVKPVLLAAAFGAFLAAPALAEKSGDGLPTVSAPPQIQVVPGLSGMAEVISTLARDQRFTGLSLDWPGIAAHYAATANRPIFTGPGGFTELGAKLKARLPLAIASGLWLPAPLVDAIGALPPPLEPDAQAEALLAAVFVASAADATSYLGAPDERGAGILALAASATDAQALIDRELPSYYRFWSLFHELPRQAALHQAGGWPNVPKPQVKKLEPGLSDPAVSVMRQRLIASGELNAADAGVGETYDPKLAEAVKTFQRSHGLLDDGIVGARTIEELNVGADRRLRQMLLNLERLRELGPAMQARHLIVNIPSQEAKVIENGKVVFHTKAIVGRVERKSPTLSSAIQTVKLNPDWTAPHKIAAIDEVRRERAEPGFLRAKGFTIYDRDGNEVEPERINWHEAGPGNFPYTLRQAPGPENALGPVKFDFPNDHAVFLHGTPTVKLFDKQDRYFSSGCVRTQTPIELAKFILKDDVDWPAARIDAALKTGKTTLVKVKSPLPIHIVYVTAWVDEDGRLQFRKDMYGYDDLPALPQGSGTLVAIGAAPDIPRGKEK